MRRISIKNLTYAALLISLNIILSRMLSIRIPLEGVEGIRIGFGNLPLILAGLLLGPLWGMVVGIVGDMIGFQINPSGFYLPTFTIAAGLSGCLPTVLLRSIFCGRMTSKNLLVVIAISQVSTALLIIPYLLYWHFGIPYVAVLPGRIISQLIIIPCLTVSAHVIVLRLAQNGIHFASGRPVES